MPRDRAAGALTLVPFQVAHVPAAASLVVDRVHALRARVPELPEAWTDPAQVGRVVTSLAERGSGAAAFRDDRLIGFQAAMLLDGRGGRWAWTPDVGHAVDDASDDRVLEALYARLAEAWARDGCPEHVVTLLADDDRGAACLARLGFGQQVVDLVRDLAPVRLDAPATPPIRRAGPADAAAIVALDRGLRRHLAAAPIFLAVGPARSAEVQRQVLADPGTATFVAEGDEGALAFLRIGPPSEDVALIVRDAETASITAAFTLEPRRGEGVATALLAAAVDWARTEGYARCAVDHETANREAGRFWSRHCTPVAMSMARRLPARVVA